MSFFQEEELLWSFSTPSLLDSHCCLKLEDESRAAADWLLLLLLTTAAVAVTTPSTTATKSCIRCCQLAPDSSILGPLQAVQQ